jgi:hypothetical protein
MQEMMMNAQESWFLYEGPSHLGSHGGTLRVEAGQVWLTSSGDPDDHILRAGEAFQVPPGDALVEPWHAGAVPARIVWEPRGWLERWRRRLLASLSGMRSPARA